MIVFSLYHQNIYNSSNLTYILFFWKHMFSENVVFVSTIKIFIYYQILHILHLFSLEYTLFLLLFFFGQQHTGTAYDLECVEHFETNPNDYYTMSKQGIYKIYFFERIFFVWGGLSIIYTY